MPPIRAVPHRPRYARARHLAPELSGGPGYDQGMPDETGTPRSRAGEIVMAAVVAVLAAGLLLIAVDVMTGGKFTKGGKGCGCYDDAGGTGD